MTERDRPAPIPRRYKTHYGTIEVAAGGFEYGERTWLRYDGYRSHDAPTSNSGYDRVFAVDKADVSRQHPRDGYDPSCSCCWLGFTHTERYHAWRLAAQEGSR